MAYTQTAVDPRHLDLTETKAPVRARRGLIRRVFDAMTVARQRQAEREIAVYLNGAGGKFTDEAEREIERRFLSNSSR